MSAITWPDFADEVRTDLHGNVIVVKNPDSPLRVMLAGHCDQIGLIVQHIDDDGFLYIQPIGGWDPEVLIGQRMTVWTDAGPVFGVIARKPIHLLTEEERKQVPKMKDLWLDIGAANKEEAAKVGPHRRRGHRGPGLPRDAEQSGRLAGDGRQGRLLGRDRGPAPGVPSRQETRLRAVRRLDRPRGTRPARRQDQRLRHRSAGRRGGRRDPRHRLPDDREEGRGRRAAGPWAGDPSRPEHEPQGGRAAHRKRADEHKIAYQLAASAKATGTDANAIQVNRAGVATGLISIPNRYMHSPVEMISLDDIDRAADLLARFAEGLEVGAELTP